MRRRTRLISVGVFAVLSTVVVGVGLSWACTGDADGIPASPAAPGPAGPTASPASSGTSVPPGTGAQATANTPSASGATSPPVAVTINGGGSSAKSFGGNRAGNGVRTQGGANRANPSSGSVPANGYAALAQRARGATAGVTRSGDQAVFASSAPDKASRGARAAAPSPRSATGDLWNGFQPASRSSVFAAEASSAKQGGGLGSPAAIGIAALSLGLAGLLGVPSVAGLRRRRAEARSAAGGSGSTTEM
jgi:hypothetical protein